MRLLRRLTGCLTHIRAVPKTRPAEVVMNATLDQLLQPGRDPVQPDPEPKRPVEVVAAEGGARQGQVKELPQLRRLHLPPQTARISAFCSCPHSWAPRRSTWSPTARPGSSGFLPQNVAMTGTSEVADPSQHGLESLRPAVIFDSLVDPGLAPNQIVVPHPGLAHCRQSERTKKDLIEEPDYDLSDPRAAPRPDRPHCTRHPHRPHESAALPAGHLRPYGTVVTRAFYSNYQMFKTNWATYPSHEDRDQTPPGPVRPDHHRHQACTLNQKLETNVIGRQLPAISINSTMK